MAAEHKEHAAAAAVAWYRLQRAHADIFKALERGLVSHGLTMPQLQVLMVINDDQAIGPVAIARRLGLEQQAITTVLDLLEQHDWIKRVRDQPDRRRVRLVITPAGAAQLERGTATVDAMLQHMFGHLGQADLLVLAELLQALREGNFPP